MERVANENTAHRGFQMAYLINARNEETEMMLYSHRVERDTLDNFSDKKGE